MRSKLLCAMLAFSLSMVFGGNSWSDDEGSKSLIVDDGIYRHPIMKPDMATLREWIKEYENAPRAFIDKRLMKTMPLTGSLDLLSHVTYTPSERNQGTCGDCWVWAGTGIMEVAHSVQDSIKDRLSIQYMNSCYSTDYACCGGNLTKFSDFYNSEGYVYPWSNTNASFQDASMRCSDASSSVSCGSVSTSPSYGITSISDVTISTLNEDQTTAINNIKNVLNQNKAVQFAFYLANDADWDVFYDFWNNDSESDVFSFDYSSGHTWVEGEGGGHAVLIVGYDDDDPNPYWKVLNSWGAETGRPNGLFRLDMNTDYNCYFYDSGQKYGSLLFQTLDVVFTGGSSNTTTTTDSNTTTTAVTTSTTTSVPEVNLTPYTPSGWDYPIVSASTMGTNYVDKLCGGKPTYIDLAAINEGPNDISETFYIALYIDGVQEESWYGEGLDANYYSYVEDYETVLDVGQHTLKLVVDSEDDVAESDENDNEYERTFTWEKCGWTPTLYEGILGKSSQERLTNLRSFRDEVLLSNDTSKVYVDLLYDHSDEVALLLAENPALSSYTEEVIEELLPGVMAVLNGEGTTISRKLKADIGALLGEFEAEASPELKTTIRKVKRVIKRGTLFRKLGMAVR